MKKNKSSLDKHPLSPGNLQVTAEDMEKTNDAEVGNEIPLGVLSDKTETETESTSDEQVSPFPIKSVISRAVDQIEANQAREDGLSGVPSGYTGIDKVTFGWQPADLIILAGLPSVGKTTFLLTMARNMAVDYDIPVCIFSQEMLDTQLVMRIVMSETGLSSETLHGAKKMSQQEWGQLHSGLSRLSTSPLFIEATAGLTVEELVKKATDMVYEHGVKLIMVDPLQMINGPLNYSRVNREQEITAICRILKETAMKLKTPIIAASQINRLFESRGGNKRPQLNDLRESGAIEQIADIIMFIHRPEFVRTQEEDGFPGETDLIIAKHRNGEVCDVKMRFLSSAVRFVDYNDAAYSGERASYTDSRMNRMSDPLYDDDPAL